MFDAATRSAVETVASSLRVEPAALLAVAEVESGGRAVARFDGREEPLIRWEGHYFDRRLDHDEREQARAAGLASPRAGAVANPASQAERWGMLEAAAKIDHQAAYESASYGVGQVMGAHWAWLGFPSVDALVALARRDVAGQIELMAKFIDKAGLAGTLRSRDWRAFARGYNGTGYAKNAYDKKIGAAYERIRRQYASTDSDRTVRRMQELLTRAGFPLAADGVRGRKTDAALRAFQKRAGLAADGVAGPLTWAALEAAGAS